MTLGDHPVLAPVVRLGLTLLLDLPLAWERRRSSRSAGLRTYTLVAVSVCGFLLIAQRTAGGPGEQADAFYGVLVGMGFVGSGAVVKSPGQARGLSTAVGLWVSGAIGAGVAYGNALISAAISLMSLLAFWAPTFARRWKAAS